MNEIREYRLHSETDLQRLAEKHVGICQAPLVVYLYGELGSGKTTFVRYLLRTLGYEGTVKSPTFTLVESYPFSSYTLYHFDLYRLKDPNELNEIGIYDYFSQDSLCFIEWPIKGEGILPPADICCYIEFVDQERIMRFSANTTCGEHLLCSIS